METIENGFGGSVGVAASRLTGYRGCWLRRKSADSTVMYRKKAVVSYKSTPAEMWSNSPSSASSYEFFAELWSQQELVTEHWFTYSRLGPGTGQVHRTG